MMADRRSRSSCTKYSTLLVLLALEAGRPVFGQLPPRNARCGEYCSFNHITGYVGPLDTNAQLREALNSVSYKQEIVFAHHAQLDFAYQMVQRWQKFGYGHLIVLYPEQRLCDRLRGAFDKLGCAWYEDHTKMAWIIKQEGGCKGCTDKWLIHYTGARAVRMGYNVLVADADTMPIYDFYGIIHQPPYNSVNMYNQREGNFNVNGGMYYIRNASRSGPVAYLLYDNILKNVRWYEDVGPLRRAVGLSDSDGSTGLYPGFLCNDQFSLSDAVHGAIVGRPQIFECVFWHHPRRPEWEKLHLGEYSKAGPQGAAGFGPYAMVKVAVPEAVRRGSNGDPEAEMVSSVLRIPHARGQWPPERGGYPFAPTLGPLASHVAELFREAGDGAPAFPDPNDPASAAAADAAPPENWAYFPPWVANTHSMGPANNGNDGWYNDHLTGQLPAALSHLHAGLTPGDFTKLVHFAVEVPDGWDFDTALRVNAGGSPYLGTELHGHTPPLLALAPGVAHAKLGWADFAAMMQGLLRLGLVLNRAVVWPWVPCEAPFLRREGATYDPAVSGHKIPWSDYINTSAAIPSGPATASLKDGLRCLVAAADKLSCLRGGTRPGAASSAPRGLLPHEFDHWLAAGRRAGGQAAAALDPSPANTVQDILKQRGGSVAPPAADASSPPPPLTLTAADLALLAADPTGAAGSSSAPVLWLSSPVVLPELPSPEHARLYDKVAAMCCVLQGPPSRECVDRPPGAQMLPT
ncbi:hypothetical protein GPECTOR_4g544 [Gonium pectorale]|uniref:Nucleotide-diphospho-sugar transferase domain-containing protein n=1 Tax=Gonium pectorale TaxID=33097 RepID=A0A150GXD2_GONPE|nr:hypothetical protein GPECTOR_4g544 [Gonium pectorale]|eukprot:KXZ54479.1 hypothetical protein GPECTOR_4g544 [Gonium pectorale]